MDRSDLVTLTLAHVLAAQQVVRPYTRHTPLRQSAGLSRLVGSDVYLKLECWQRTGSFKVRGALNKLAVLPEEEWAQGVVTASAGNHGLGVAFASQLLTRRHRAKLPTTVFVPESIPTTKLDRLTVFDCQIRRAGTDYDESHTLAKDHARQQGAIYISAYDDLVVIAGQGTVGLEVMQDLPSADLLLVPVGGGGLISGVTVVAKAINPRIHIMGLQPEASPSAYLSLRDGRPYETYAAGPTICDGLAGGFGRVPFEMASKLIDEILVIPEADIRQAVAWLVAREQLLVEGSGAIAVAPLLKGQFKARSRKVVCLLTGRNLDAALLQDILAEQGSP
jgi:threonine dehydratase